MTQPHVHHSTSNTIPYDTLAHRLYKILVNSVACVIYDSRKFCEFTACHISYDKTRILPLFITNQFYYFCIKNDPDISTFVLSNVNMLDFSKQSMNNVEFVRF